MAFNFTDDYNFKKILQIKENNVKIVDKMNNLGIVLVRPGSNSSPLGILRFDLKPTVNEMW